MAGPPAPQVVLSATERAELERLTRAHHSGQQLVLRAQLILDAATGLSNSMIARAHQVHVQRVRHSRTRWLGLQAVPLREVSVTERLADAPRAGDQSLSHWSGRALARASIERGIVARISPRHVRRLLKKGRSSRTVSATG